MFIDVDVLADDRHWSVPVWQPSRTMPAPIVLHDYGATFAKQGGSRAEGSMPAPLFQLLAVALLLSARIRAGSVMEAATALRNAGLTTRRAMADKLRLPRDPSQLSKRVLSEGVARLAAGLIRVELKPAHEKVRTMAQDQAQVKAIIAPTARNRPTAAESARRLR